MLFLPSLYQNLIVSVCLVAFLSGCSDQGQNGESSQNETPPSLHGVVNLSGLGGLSQSKMRIFVAPSLSIEMQNDLVETTEIMNRIVKENLASSLEKAVVKQELIEALENTEATLNEKTRILLDAYYKNIPKALSDTFGTTELMTTSNAIIDEFRGYFAKINIQKVYDDVNELNQKIQLKASELNGKAEVKTRYSDTINFFGIEKEKWTKEDKTQVLATVKEVNQARIDLVWLQSFHNHIQELGKKIGSSHRQLADFVNADPVSRRAQLPPLDAWNDFMHTRGLDMYTSFKDFQRYQPNEVGEFFVKEKGYVIAEVMINGKLAYFAESIPDSPVVIKRLK